MRIHTHTRTHTHAHTHTHTHTHTYTHTHTHIHTHTHDLYIYIYIPEESALRKKDTTAENRPILAENAEKRPNTDEQAKNAENRPNIINARMQEETAVLRGGGGGGGGGGVREKDIKDKDAEKRFAGKRSDIAENAGKRPNPTENAGKRPNIAEKGGGGRRKRCPFGSRWFPWIPENCGAVGLFCPLVGLFCLYSLVFVDSREWRRWIFVLCVCS